MTPSKLSQRVVGEKLEWINKMLEGMNSLPLKSYEEFVSDSRNIWAAESCLRRSLEALFDMGRHILSKCFGRGVAEYKEVAIELEKNAVLSEAQANLFRILAGYRNRLVHFYEGVTEAELYSACTDNLGDIVTIRDAYLDWIKKHPDMIEEQL
jgi:uncharacterized protein YutE (UPF0331/DUF86 family)